MLLVRTREDKIRAEMQRRREGRKDEDNER